MLWGGSSLAPEVLRAVLGIAPDWPRFHMLDSTDPAAIRAVATPPARTLYILASKSGTTIEPNSLAAHFRHELEASVADWNDHFVAITDEGTELARRARHERFRDVFISTGKLSVRVPDRIAGDDLDAVALTLSSAARTILDGRPPEAFLTLLHEGDYFGLLAYLGPDPELAARLHALRVAVRDRTRAATMFGYGPRYLHSTGQLHKGGPDTGVFLLITATPREDLPIPGQAFSFGTLEFAQAVGDFASLDTTGRRALHVHLPAPDHRLLAEITNGLLERLPKRSGQV